jgi:hypothetical protein
MSAPKHLHQCAHVKCPSALVLGHSRSTGECSQENRRVSRACWGTPMGHSGWTPLSRRRRLTKAEQAQTRALVAVLERLPAPQDGAG